METTPPSYDSHSVTEDIESLIESSLKLQNEFYQLRRLVAEADEIRDMSLKTAAMDCDEKYQGYLSASRNASTRLNTLVQRFATHMVSIAQSPHIETDQKIQSIKLTVEKISRFPEDNSRIVIETSGAVRSAMDVIGFLLGQVNRMMVLEKDIIPEMRKECKEIDQEWTNVEPEHGGGDWWTLDSVYQCFSQQESVMYTPDGESFNPRYRDPEEERFYNTKLGPRFPESRRRRPNPRYNKAEIPLESELNAQHLERCKLCGDRVVALQERLYPPMADAEDKVKVLKGHYESVLRNATAFDGILRKLSDDAQALIQYLEDPMGTFQEQDLLSRIQSEAPIYERIHQALDYYALKV